MQGIETERLEIILNALKQGLLADEIDQILEEQGRLRSEQLGYRSEEKVRRVLLGLPEVSAVHRTKKRSLADLLGIDLIVYLREENTPPYLYLGVVSVQVKSSRYGIEAYIKELMGRWQSSRESVTARLKAERLIILNGQNDEERVVCSFRRQLKTLRTSLACM